MALPGLTRDAIAVSRPGTTVDAEGNAIQALAEHLTTRGTWGSPSFADLQLAGRRGQQVDAVVAMPTADITLGDFVDVRGRLYEVVAVADTRTHMRLFLRMAE